MKYLIHLAMLSLMTGCTIFGNGGGDQPGFVDPLEATLLYGQWQEVQRFDLLANSETKLGSEDAQVLAIDENNYSMLAGVRNSGTCVNRKSYSIEGRFIRLEGEKKSMLEVKGVDKTNMNLIEYGETGTPVYEHLFQKRSETEIKNLFATNKVTDICLAFASYIETDNGADDDGVFRPDIDIGSDYRELNFTEALTLTNSQVDSGFGYVRFVVEDQKFFRTDAQPKSSLFCEFNFIDLGQITRSDGSYTFAPPLSYRVITASRNTLADGSSSLVLLMDGCEVTCVDPVGGQGISDADLKKALDPSISIR